MAVKYGSDTRVYRRRGEHGSLKAFSCHLRLELLVFSCLKKNPNEGGKICNTYFVFPSAKWLQRWVCPEGKVTS